jgi:hypothetical protein
LDFVLFVSFVVKNCLLLLASLTPLRESIRSRYLFIYF